MCFVFPMPRLELLLKQGVGEMELKIQDIAIIMDLCYNSLNEISIL